MSYSGKDFKIASFEGIITDEPRLRTGLDGKYVSYSFVLGLTDGGLVMVSFHTILWGKKVAEFTSKKGDKISLEGKLHESKTIGKVKGTLHVNDVDFASISELP